MGCKKGEKSKSIPNPSLFQVCNFFLNKGKEVPVDLILLVIADYRGKCSSLFQGH